MMKAISKHDSARDTYLELVRMFPLTTIRDDQHLQSAIDVINALTDRELDPQEQIYLDTLVTLVEVYESALPGFDNVGVADILKHLMDANRDKQSTLVQKAGISKSLLSEILNGKSRVTLATARKLSQAYHVPVSVFIE